MGVMVEDGQKVADKRCGRGDKGSKQPRNGVTDRPWRRAQGVETVESNDASWETEVGERGEEVKQRGQKRETDRSELDERRDKRGGNKDKDIGVEVTVEEERKQCKEEGGGRK